VIPREFGTLDRAQANVVGVALLLAITTISLGVLTAGVGSVVESNAAAADANRVADSFESLQPSKATGVERQELAFGEGSLRVVDRTVRVLDGDRVVTTHEADALVFETGSRRVAFLAGAVVRGSGTTARLAERPPISTADSLIVIGLPVLNASGPDAVSGSGGTKLTLQTDTSHDRTALGAGQYRIAVETATPAAWERHFEAENAATTRRDFDDDGVPSVVATYPGERTAYLVVHDATLEVRR
jgi:hypothetical protein